MTFQIKRFIDWIRRLHCNDNVIQIKRFIDWKRRLQFNETCLNVSRHIYFVFKYLIHCTLTVFVKLRNKSCWNNFLLGIIKVLFFWEMVGFSCYKMTKVEYAYLWIWFHGSANVLESWPQLLYKCTVLVCVQYTWCVTNVFYMPSGILSPYMLNMQLRSTLLNVYI